MRIRFKPYARPELAAWPHFVDEPAQKKGNWRQTFPHPGHPLHLELGCGKGGFLSRLALQHPGCNYLGLDIKNEMLVLAKRNIERQFAAAGTPPANVFISSLNIEYIETILALEDKIERIYINFCNPWYKSGYAKHRLTHPRQLAKYRAFLADDGEIYFKTDDDPLFNDSLRYFEYCGFEVSWLTRDLHHTEPTWNIRTEHEQMFSQQGIPIKACIVKKIEKNLDLNAIARLKNI